MKKNRTNNDTIDISVGDIIKYKFLFSSEIEHIGLVYKIKKDLNFSYLLHILKENNQKDLVPFNLLNYTILS